MFSNISYHHLPQLARAAGAADRSALPLAGDEQEAKVTVGALVDRLGFDTVDVGGLEESWRFEPDTAAYLRPYASPELKGLEDLRSTPAVALAASLLKDLVGKAERTDQGARTF